MFSYTLSPLIHLFKNYAADLQKENTEKEEKMNKIKAVAVKARKELDSSRKEVCSLCLLGALAALVSSCEISRLNSLFPLILGL